MSSLDDSSLPHFLAALVLISRIGDVASTYLLSPTLLMEGNMVARRGGWPLASASLLLALVPYYSTALGVVVLTSSFLVTGSNLLRGWIARALGEGAYYDVFLRAASRGRRGSALAFVLVSAACPLLVGVLMMWFSRGATDWAYWFGLGVALYGSAVALHGSGFVLHVFREAGSPERLRRDRDTEVGEVRKK